MCMQCMQQQYSVCSNNNKPAKAQHTERLFHRLGHLSHRLGRLFHHTKQTAMLITIRCLCSCRYSLFCRYGSFFRSQCN